MAVGECAWRDDSAMQYHRRAIESCPAGISKRPTEWAYAPRCTCNNERAPSRAEGGSNKVAQDGFQIARVAQGACCHNCVDVPPQIYAPAQIGQALRLA